MPKFKYKAQNEAGKAVSGSLDADNQSDVVAQLRRQKLSPINIKQVGGGKKRKGGGGNAATEVGIMLVLNAILMPFFGVMMLPGRLFGGGGGKGDMMVVFTRQLSTMIGAGIPILECLEVLCDQSEDKGFAQMLNDVVEDVRTGNDLSSSMGAHPKYFTRIYIAMIKAGEASGQIDIILVRLAEYMEATAKLKREIKSAMTYPVISLCMVLGITAFLMIGIVPKFKDIFDSMSIDLPWITITLLAISMFMRDYWYMIFLGSGVFVFALVMYRKTDVGERQFDWITLKAPIFGKLFQKIAISRFSKTFSTLIKSGVPILGALEIVSETAGNRIVKEAIDSARENVRQGETLGEPLGQFWVFPPMVAKMITIGERSGALEQLLEKISEFYDQQVSATVESLTAMIEPLLIGVMGFLVGAIVLAVFLPIFKLQESLASGH